VRCQRLAVAPEVEICEREAETDQEQQLRLAELEATPATMLESVLR
jgi:hypothetical protein